MKSPPPKPQSGKCPKSQAQERPFEFLSPQEKRAKAQADADHWLQVVALPGLSPNAVAWASNLARSAKAEVALRLKALIADAPTVDLMKRRLVDLNSLPQEPLTELNTPTSVSSTKAGTCIAIAGCLLGFAAGFIAQCLSG